MKHFLLTPLARHLLNAVLSTGLILSLPALAAPVQLATSPLATSSSSVVSPNLMVMLDDSGSMDWDYMPDIAKNFVTKGNNVPDTPKYGYNSSQCNGVAYNPAITYSPPATSTGASYASSSFTAAWDDGYTITAGTTNLSTSFTGGSGSGASGINLTPAPAFYYTYHGAQTTPAQQNYFNTSGTFYLECNSNIGSAPGNAAFTKVIVGATSGPGNTDERTNFSNWYSYYSNRMLMMKTGLGLAFKPMSNKFRIGFMTMNNNVSPGFLNIASFDATQKSNWYSKLYASTPGNTTPLREALSKIGQLYANKFLGTTTYTATITVGGSGSTSVSSVTVGGSELMGGTSTGSTSTSTVAKNVASQLNTSLTSPYSAGRTNNIITITGPASALGLTPVISKSGTMTMTVTAFVANTIPAQLNGANPTDPMQYSCQKNFVILSTDGYWNSNAGYKLDNTAIGNQDNNVPRPYYDGMTVNQTTSRVQQTTTQIAQATSQTQQRTQQIQSRTSTLQSQTSQLQTQTSYLQSQTSQLQTQTSSLQSQTSQLQTQTSSLQSQTSQLQTQTSSLQSQTSQLQAVTQQLQISTKTTSSGSFSTFTDTSSCTYHNTGTYPRTKCQYNPATTTTGVASCTVNASSSTADGAVWVGSTATTACNTVVTSAYANASSCTATTTPNGSGNTTQCQYTPFSSWSGTSTCSTAAKSTGPGYTVGTARNCQTTVTSAYANASSCTVTTTPNGSGNTTQCQYTPFSSWSGTSTCSTAAQSTGPGYTVGTARNCQTAVTSAYANASSCTVTTTPNGSGNTTQCQYTPYSSWSGTSTCSTAAQSTGPGYTVGTARNCQTAVTSAYANVSSCSVTSPNASGNSTQCRYSAWGAGVGSATCNAVAQSTGPTNYTVGTANQCLTVVSSPYANTASCTTNATPDSSGNTTQCQYTAYSAWANTATCAPTAQATSSPYTVGTSYQCQTTDTGFVGASACSPSSNPSTGQTITCNTATTGGATNYVASCSTTPASLGNSWVTTTCPTITVGPTYVASCTPVAASAGNSFTATTCNPTSNTVTLTGSTCTPQTASAGNGFTTITCAGSAGGTSDTLADTAMYYYQTDLRTSTLGNCTGTAGADVCQNNVPISGIDTNDAQHLTSFTLGLGARGRMNFSSTYLTDPSGDYYSVSHGVTASPSANPPVCSWQTSGACNWPTPSSGAPENIDDLWHAAVNGRGTYFSATDPLSLSVGLSDTLQKINQVTGAAAAAATSTLNPVADNNFAYVASYTTIRWVGNLEQRTINIASGVVSPDASWCVENIAPPTCVSPNTIVADTGGSSTVYYCAATATDVNHDGVIDVSDCQAGDIFDSATTTCRTPISNVCVGTLPLKVAASTDTRAIYTANSTGTALTNFDAAYATANPTNFSAAHISGLSQWTALTATQQTAAAGTNLINYLRGQNGYEENRTANVADNWLYRYRDAVMGDALESQPTFVSAPTFSYADAGYTAFKDANVSRSGTVFIGANDGMLHAFAASNGVERWAYIPTSVIPNMWKLADKNYATQHVNFVNGSAVISDICTANCSNSSAVWKTILVGGLNAGGRGYYALDITDPVTPILMWEFTSAQNANLGYTYGKPVITKKQDGTWVVLVTSGYDNGTLGPDNVTANSPAGSGVGYLYVVNAATGSVIDAISTGVGSAATPSGLAKFNAYSELAGTNQAGYVYAGDLLGNLWRFDINTAASPLLFATLKDSSSVAQPITMAPTLGKVNGNRVIYVGTGKYLEPADLSSTQEQTLYAIQDADVTSTLVNPRTTLVQQTITSSTSTRTGSSNPVNLNAGRGWYVDFPDTGERANIDFKLVQGTLLVPTIVPSSTICSPGGYGWLNYFNYENGNPASSNNVVSQKYDSTIVGMNVIYINGQPIVEIVTSSNPTPEIPPLSVPFRATSTGSFSNKREIWRELIQ